MGRRRSRHALDTEREREREREREGARAKIFLAGLLNRRWNKQTKRTVASQITSPPQP